MLAADSFPAPPDPVWEHRWTRSADGTRLHVYAAGRGAPALVCLDGLGCGGYIWPYVARDFAPSRRVVRLHWRGHGESDPPADRARMRIADLVEDLEAAVALEGLERPVLLGHSLGVQAALEYHRRHPEAVSGLVLVCGSAGRLLHTFHGRDLLPRVFPRIRAVVDRFPRSVQKGWSAVVGSELAYRFATAFECNGSLIRRADFQAFFDHTARMDVGLFLALAQSGDEHDAWGHLPEIDVPVLVVAGTHDTFTPFELSRRMASLIPGAELLVVPGGTHTAAIELPELVDLRVARFLRERVESAASAAEGGAA